MSFKMEWNADRLMKDLEKQAVEVGLKGAEEDIRRDVAALRCPVHGESPRIASTSTTGNRLTTSISACCDDMLEKAQRIAAGQG